MFYSGGRVINALQRKRNMKKKYVILYNTLSDVTEDVRYGFATRNTAVGYNTIMLYVIMWVRPGCHEGDIIIIWVPTVYKRIRCSDVLWK